VVHAAEAHAASGGYAHILWCGAEHANLRMCRRFPCATSRLADIHFPTTLSLDGPHLFAALHESDRVLFALRQLHAQHRFAVIELPERAGLGFRTLQAKQTGQAFADVRIAVRAQGLTSTLRQAHEKWLCNPHDVMLDYAERYSLRYGAEGPCVHPPTTASGAQPLVTICVPYYNLGDYLEETLTSLAWQSYANLEVFVINDGSTDARAVEVFRQMQARFPHFRFLDQVNAGIGATRNRGLQMAHGAYFLPVDADNIADPDMVRRFVAGMEHNGDIAALTCYFLAFREFADLIERRFLYAYKPTGGPRVLGCLQNVYGDGNAMFRTEALRAVGGFETDRDTSFEDWEAFVKLVNAGDRVEVLPDFLFYYRHRDAGFSRVTNDYRNHQRVLRRFVEIEKLPPADRQMLWNLLAGYHHHVAELNENQRTLQTQLGARRYRAIDRLLKIAKTVTGSWRS